MRSQSLALAVFVLLIILMALSGLWLWRRLAVSLVPAPTASATPTPAEVPVPTATALQAPPGYRLAGVALGDPDSFAVIEAPDGRHTLYRVDGEIPGLGRLIHVEAEHVVIVGATGQFELWVAPAPTPTPTRGRAPTRRPGDTRTPTQKPRPVPPDAGTTLGSTPSSAPD